jgi:hypothetical protein
MKKLVWLLVLALLVVPAFASSAEFDIGILPKPGYFQPGNFTLVWSGKYSDLVDAWAGMGFGVWQGHTDWGNPGLWYAGGINIKNLLNGLADLRLAWNEDVTDSWIGGTMLVSKPLEGYNTAPDSFSGIVLTLKTPLKVVVGVRSNLSDNPYLVDRVAVRVDGTFAPLTLYALGYFDVSNTYTISNTTADLGLRFDYTVGNMSLRVVGEVKSPTTGKWWVLRGQVTPLPGVTVQGRYYSDSSYRLYLTLSNLIPNTTIEGMYRSDTTNQYYVYATTTQKTPFGDLTLWGGIQQGDPTWAFYAKLVTPFHKNSGLTNTLKVFQNYSDDPEVSWFSSSDFTIVDAISINF